MKKTSKILALCCAAVMAAVCFASCGNDGDAETTPTGPTGLVSGDTQAESTDPVESADAAVKVIDIKLTEEEYALGVDKNQPELLEKVNAFITKIQEDGTMDEIFNKYFGDGEPTAVKSAELDTSKDQLVVATNASFEPFEYMLGEDYYGIDMEIASLMAQEFGMELVISNMDFDAVCLSVGQGKCDIAAAGLTIREDREEYVNFSNKYYDASQMLIVKADDTTFDSCSTADDVVAILNTFDENTKIGVQNGTTGQFYV